MKHKLFLLFIILLSTFIFSKGNTYKYNDLDVFIDSLYNKLEMTGLSVLITKDGELVYENNKGYKKLPGENYPGERLLPGDLFRIASISKSFVATVIMKLVEEGKLSLDNDAQKYLSFPLRNPNFPDIPITIDMLLTHSSTINDSQGYHTLDVIIPEKNNKYKDSYLNGPPGKRFKYSNLNYNILGAVIENVTGERFDYAMSEHIFNPLGIDANFNPNDLATNKFVNNYSFSPKTGKYVESKEAYLLNQESLKNYILGESTAVFSPCGGVKISSKDLAKYMNMHLNMGNIDNIEIISPESETILRSKQNWIQKDYNHSISSYEGWIPGRNLLGQTGGALGLKSAMIFDPLSKLGFIIISSGSKSNYPSGINDIHIPIVQYYFKNINNI